MELSIDVDGLRELLENTDNKLDVFSNMELLSKYGVEKYNVFTFNPYDFVYFKDLVDEFLNDEEKLKLFEYSYFRELPLEMKCYIICLVSDIELLISFICESDFCKENNIKPYEIVQSLKAELQRDFVMNLQKMSLTLNEKREILATLSIPVKQAIDVKSFPKEYKTAISLQTEDGKVIIDLERDLEDYRGLDNIIKVNPEKFTDEQRKKFIELCHICPNLKVANGYLYDGVEVEYLSTVDEYIEGEQWIESIIHKLHGFSKAQKLAIIDNEIGKKISYSPDDGTEISDSINRISLWKIIVSGYGVCNGISKVEQYILYRAGIESEIVHCDDDGHVFLRVKDIEFPLASGEVVKGDTIVDGTWNLASHRFDGKPDNFCISYKQARQNDVGPYGVDYECHKNDDLQDVTLSLDAQSLRDLFKSVGLTDKNGEFLLNKLIEKSKLLHEYYKNEPIKNINKQFLLLYEACPEFAKCQNATMSILNEVLLNSENLLFNNCAVHRVYDRQDKAKEPVLYVYIDLKDIGEKFYFADKNIGQFVELPKEQFVKRFECYEMDLEENDGLRPWEFDEQIERNIDLSRSSGTVTGNGEVEEK